MLTRDALRLAGTITVRVTNIATGAVETMQLRNAVTDDGLDVLKNALLGNVTADNLKLKYVALGTDPTAVTGTESQLGTEVFRKQVTDRSDEGTGLARTIGLILAGEAAGENIEEIGWFAGPAATAAANTGTLWARVLYSRAKTALESIQITRDDQSARA